MKIADRMLRDGVAPVRMERNENQGDFESCNRGWKIGQALCIWALNEFVNVSKAQVIEVMPMRRGGENHLHIKRLGNCAASVDGEYVGMYTGTAKVANHWMKQGYSHVRIDILEIIK